MKIKFIILALFAGAVVSAQQMVFDPDFGVNGISVTAIDNDTERSSDIEIQQDGKILSVGFNRLATNSSYSYISLVRYLDNGSLDPDFGTAGVVTEHMNTETRASGVKVQSDGKIIIAGYTQTSVLDHDALIIRYNPDGTRDATFGDNGLILLAEPGSSFGMTGRFSSLLIQPDDKILAGGMTNVYSETAGWYQGFALYRFNADGTPDSTFGVDGRAITDFDFITPDPWDEIVEDIEDIALMPDGKIVVATSTFYNHIVSRLNADGTFDTAFGTNGSTVLNVNLFSRASLLLQQDGKPVISGSAYPEGNGGQSALVHYLVRLTADGQFDSNFGFSGRMTSVFPGFAFRGGDAILLPDGKILSAGYPFVTFVNLQSIVLIRYNSDGNYDDSFGPEGRQLFQFAENEGYNVSNLLMQEDGKILLSGSTGINPDLNPPQDLFIMRMQEEELVSLNDNVFGSVTLYPNPASSAITLANAENSTIENLTVTDMTGKLVLSQKSNNPEINVEVLPAGIYFLNVSAQEGVQHLKFVKE